MFLTKLRHRSRGFTPYHACVFSTVFLLLAPPLSGQSQFLSGTSTDSGQPVTRPYLQAEMTGELKGETASAREGAAAEDFNPFDADQFQAYLSRGLALQEAGEHESALPVLDRAWQINRIERGLYHESQVPVLESMVVSELESGDFEAVNRHYAYMEHLYRRLYDIDDPRLDSGLQKISSFHVNAFNVNLAGQREYHLRKAASILKLRLEVAERTLAEDHPKVNYLTESIALSRHQLYLMSDRHKEMLARKQASSRDRLFATLE
ncbi:MAG: hypothetical protein WD396_09490 [Pseudohongiellaceae bacterium]